MSTSKEIDIPCASIDELVQEAYNKIEKYSDIFIIPNDLNVNNFLTAPIFPHQLGSSEYTCEELFSWIIQHLNYHNIQYKDNINKIRINLFNLMYYTYFIVKAENLTLTNDGVSLQLLKGGAPVKKNRKNFYQLIMFGSYSFAVLLPILDADAIKMGFTQVAEYALTAAFGEQAAPVTHLAQKSLINAIDATKRKTIQKQTKESRR